MLYSPHNFHTIDLFKRPARLLTDNEKKDLLSYAYSSLKNMHTISIDDWVSIQLGAKEDDIICIRHHHNDIYRLVVSRQPLI